MATTLSITCKYTVPVVGVMTAAALQTAMENVAVDSNFLLFRGLRVTSDVTSIIAAGPSSNVVRTIVTSTGPNADQAASITAELYPGGSSSSPIKDLVVGTSGAATYVRPPVLEITDTKGSGASGHAQLGVTSTTLGGGGANYTAQTVATASGGLLAVDGTQATFTVTIAGGVIQSVNTVDGGGPYNVPPVITISDAGGGSGALVTPVLGVTGAVLDKPGQNYVNPQVNAVNYFLHMCPTQASQIASMQGFMTNILQNALGVAVLASAPTLA